MAVKNRCVLIGAGEMKITQLSLEEDDFVIAVDGGLDHCKRLQIRPNLLVGDFDSVESDLTEYRGELIKLPCEKDDTDMIFAIKEGMKRGYNDFLLYGATGGRLDHTIANIQTLIFINSMHAKGMILDDKLEIQVLTNHNTITFGKERKGILSVFSLDAESKGVNITGMKYELADATIHSNFPIGVSNEFIGEPGSVSVEDGTLLLICQDS